MPDKTKTFGTNQKTDRIERFDPSFYATKPWKAIRAYVLRKQPICTCGAVATEVHHKIERANRPDLELDENNLEGKCCQCHSKITARNLNEKNSVGNNVTNRVLK